MVRRFLVVGLVLALHAAPRAQVPATRQTQAQPDPVARVLLALESAVGTQSYQAFLAIASPRLPERDLAVYSEATEGQGVVAATLRERDRRADAGGFVVLADLLISHGLGGRIVTWEVTLRPGAGEGRRLEIGGLKQIALVDGLVKLTLDRDRQYTVRDLTFTAPDFSIRMASGTAFMAQGDVGNTAIVLRGRADVRFSPPDQVEQEQIKLWSGQKVLETTIDAAFIRVSPAAFRAHVSEGSLVPAPANADQAGRAQEIFDQFSGRTFNLGLSDLTSARWSLLPSGGSLAVEFKTPRFGWLTYTRSPSDDEDITLFDRARARHLSAYASAEKIATRGRFYDEDADATYDVLHYGLDLAFDPARSWVSGHGRLRVRVLSPSTQRLAFRLAESLNISSVTSPELGRLLAVRVLGQTSIIVSLPEMLTAGQEASFDFAYSGRIESQELSREALRVEGQSQTPPEMLMPEARFMYSNHVFWYPQGIVTDYATASLRLTVPADYQIIASGSLIGSSVSANERASRSDLKSLRTTEFFSDHPVRYLACVITKLNPVARITVPVPAVALADAGGRTPPASSPAVYVEVSATPRLVGRNRQAATIAGDAVKFYARLFGEAPYPTLTVAAADALLPGGHAPAYFVLIQQPLPGTPFTWQDDPLAFDRYPNFLFAHEIAHQWWGQAVGFKNYHDQWLSEGLAQYSAVMWLADGKPETLHSLIKQMRESAELFTTRGAIYLGYRLGHIEGRGAVFRGTIYNKSAVVLHMLRRIIGDEAFTSGLRAFYHRWRFSKAGTDDLRQAFETAAGRPLSRFFERWVLGSTLPRLRVTSRTTDGGAAAVIRVEQIGDVFDVPLTIGIDYADGRSEDVEMILTEPATETRVPLKGPVRKIAPKDELTLATYIG